ASPALVVSFPPTGRCRMTVMSWDEWARHDATALAAEVRAGRVTPRELAEQAAEGMARVNPKVNAVIEVFADTLANPDTDDPNKEAPSLQPPLQSLRCCYGLLRPCAPLRYSRPRGRSRLRLVPSRRRHDETQVVTFHTKAWSSVAPPTCRMPLGQYQGNPRADPAGKVTHGS